MLDISAPVLADDSEGRQRDIACEMLRADIVACRLAPGVSVTENVLTERYGIGKAAIRGALLRLAERGWVRALSRRGYIVKPIALRDIGEMFELRRIVEPAAARLAAGRVDINRLREIEAVCGAGVVPGDTASETTFLQAHRQMHLTVVLSSGNRRLAEDFRHLWDEVERVIYHTGLLRTRADELRHDHDALIAALTGGRGDDAAAAIDEEIESLHRMIVDTALKTASMLVPAAGTTPAQPEESRAGP